MTTTFPTFVPPHVPDANGADYLGIRAINLSLMAGALPGINNVVSSVRPFALISWVAWRYYAATTQLGQAPSVAELTAFCQKVETLFVWAHADGNVGKAIPGIEAARPPDEMVLLSFATCGRPAGDRGFRAAAQYGPGLRFPEGLGLTQVQQGLFAPAAGGNALALAFDVSLRAALTPAQYAFLEDIHHHEISQAEVAAFLPALLMDAPSPAEQQVFAGLLYQEGQIGAERGGALATRSALLHLVRETVSSNPAPMSADAVRQSIALNPCPPSCINHPAFARLEAARRRWQVIQVRQAQRLDLESLFGWVERALLEGATSLNELVALAYEALEQDPQGLAANPLARWTSYGELGSVELMLAGVPGGYGPQTLFEKMDSLERTIRGRITEGPMVYESLELLLHSGALAEALKLTPMVANISDGPTHRLPLGLWGTLMSRYAQQPALQLLHTVLSKHVVAQHFGVAASRSSDERSRTRIGNEDRGMASLLPDASSALVAVRTDDRLDSAMALMASSGILAASAPLRFQAECVYSAV